MTDHAITQAPGFYRRRLGELTVTVVNDGYFPASYDLVTGPLSATEAARIDGEHFRISPPRLWVNAFVISGPGQKSILVDAGGPGGFSPAMGHLPTNLHAAGIDPAGIGTVLMTHLHPDHVGNLAADGKAAFPNAELVVSEGEEKIWLTPEALAGASEGTKGYIELAQSMAAPYRERLRIFSGEAAVLPGITAVPLPGHTPGHTGFAVTSGSETLLIWADVVHWPALQFDNPDVGLAFDADHDKAVQTRKRTLDHVATDRLLVTGTHLDWPNFGHVLRHGSSYAWVAEPWNSAP